MVAEDDGRQALAAEIARLAAAVERLDRRFDEFARVFLNAKFPHGKATDRWGRR